MGCITQKSLFPTAEYNRLGKTGDLKFSLDVWVLPYAIQSVEDVMKKFGVDTPKFRRFVDEQLMITAQSKAEGTPFLFGAAGLTYTNYSNFYVPGGLLEMINSIRSFIQEKGGALHTREAVTHLSKKEEEFIIQTKKEIFTKLRSWFPTSRYGI